jgi:hypothetical protein
MANRLGGWGFGEAEMVRLHQTRDVQEVSVFLGTASFPAAVQGEISIAHGYRGHSKTFMGDGAAFVHALDYARLLLQGGIVDQVLVGAVEAITSPWVLEQLGTPPLSAAAGFLVLSAKPEPTFLLRLTAEPLTSNKPAAVSVQATDDYPVQTAMRLINAVETALPRAPTEIALVLPGESRQLVFRIQ